MERDFLELLKEIGVDTDGALWRFSNNRALYEKFLLKFPSEETFALLKNSVANKDAEGALIYSHTLKGMSGNLGLTPLYDKMCAFVDRIRAGDADGAFSDYDALEQEYTKILGIINEKILRDSSQGM